MTKVRITQIKSNIDRSKKQKATLKALGLNKVNSSAEHRLNPNIQGMINRVAHLVRVEESEDQAEPLAKVEEKEVRVGHRMKVDEEE